MVACVVGSLGLGEGKNCHAGYDNRGWGTHINILIRLRKIHEHKKIDFKLKKLIVQNTSNIKEPNDSIVSHD